MRIRPPTHWFIRKDVPKFPDVQGAAGGGPPPRFFVAGRIGFKSGYAPPVLRHKPWVKRPRLSEPRGEIDSRAGGGRLVGEQAPGWRNWQTRKLEVLVSVRTCWFDSSLGQFNPAPFGA